RAPSPRSRTRRRRDARHRFLASLQAVECAPSFVRDAVHTRRRARDRARRRRGQRALLTARRMHQSVGMKNRMIWLARLACVSMGVSREARADPQERQVLSPVRLSIGLSGIATAGAVATLYVVSVAEVNSINQDPTYEAYRRANSGSPNVCAA